MIVKIAHPKREDSFKTLAKYIQRDLNDDDSRDNFASLSRYMARDEEFKATATNCGCDESDIDTAVKVVLATQNLNTRAKKKTMHLIVSFAAGERPTETQLTLIENRLIASVGMQDLQRVRVVHDDTDHLHMHIAVNRIHPKTLRSMQPSRDYQSLSRCARELELELGLSRCHGRATNHLDLNLTELLQEQKAAIQQHVSLSHTWEDLHTRLAALGIGIRRRRSGVVFIALNSSDNFVQGITVPGSSIDRKFSRSALEKQLGPMHDASDKAHRQGNTQERETISDAARRQERHRGTESFQRWALEHRSDVASRVAEASTWHDVHQSLAELQLGLTPYRAGLSLINLGGRGAIAASRMDRSMSRKALEARLGKFEPSDQEQTREPKEPDVTYTERPLSNNQSLYDRYLLERDAQQLRFEHARERRQANRDRAFVEFSRKYAAEARSIRANPLLTAFGKRLAFQRLTHRRKRAYLQLKSRRNNQNIRRPPSYRQWLLDQALAGDIEARDALQQISARVAEPVAWAHASNGRVNGEANHKREHIRPSAIFRDGSIEFVRNGIPLIDDGERLHVTKADLESVRSLLESAREKYEGPLEIRGTYEFLTSVTICALDMPELSFANPDLQHRIDRLRARQNTARESGLER